MTRRVVVHVHNTRGAKDRKSFAGYGMGDAIGVADVLTEKGQEILKSMRAQYGKEKGEEVFYASIKAGRITGAEDEMSDPISEQVSSGETEPDIGSSEAIGDTAPRKCKCGAHKK